MKLIIFEKATEAEISLAYKQLRTDGFLMISVKPEVIELTETERIKLGDLEIERPVEKDPLDEIFEEELIDGIPAPRYVPGKKRLMDSVTKVKIPKGTFQKKKKSKKIKKSIPRKQAKYTPEILKYIKENVNQNPNSEMCKLLKKNFEINVNSSALSALLAYRKIKRVKNHHGKQNEYDIYSEKQSKHDIGIVHYNQDGKYLCNPKVKPNLKKLTFIGEDVTCDNCKYKLEKPIEPVKIVTPKQIHDEEIKKRKRKGMSKEAIEIIEENYMEKTDEELREIIADKVGAFHAVDKIETYRETNGMTRPMGWSPEDYDDYEEEE